MNAPNTRKIRRVEGIVAVVVVLLGWFANVLGAAQGMEWLGPLVVLVFSVLHCTYSLTWRDDLRLMAALAVVGTALDSLQGLFGFVTFYGRPEAWPGWLAPPWIAALWFHFGTLRWVVFRTMARHKATAVCCGLLLAPLAYWGGVELDAAGFAEPTWISLLSFGVQWAILLPVASWWTWRRYS